MWQLIDVRVFFKKLVVVEEWWYDILFLSKIGSYAE
jgi:hypothetical protein